MEKTMNPTAAVPVTRLPPGLPTVVMGDGTRCLVDNNTIWIPAGNHVNLQPGYAQPKLLQPAVTVPQPPPCSKPRVMMPVCQLPVSLPSSELDLHLMRPKAFSCVLPPLDLPSPGPHPQSIHVATPAIPTTSSPKPNVQQKLKPELKPCKHKPHTFRPKQPKPHIPKEKVSKPRPESKPYFVPQPLGAKHIKPQSKTLGNRITKSEGGISIIEHVKSSSKLSFAEQLKSADRAYLKPKSVLPSTGCKTLPVPVKKVKDKVVSETESAKSGDISAATVSVNAAKAVDKAEPNSDDEYDVEYLYLTKLILRKKRKPTAEPSTEPLPSRKRKCPDDNSEVPQAVKQARLEEPQDTLEDLEALLAEYSTSLSSGTRDFF
ncbi:ESX-1 secretion-associated protein EspI-like [Haliotis rubra]|uniref:ESX-1 secretion-associated protein EspI-like n=1 Tax=Haliotis rubra TaxID=36100 RepID=UPI001EE60B94|nr:ESX-1 secretion-associated protein EspI-like [Haliotis rubra]